MSLDSAIQHLLKAKRISAASQSYAKDNPGEWAKVKAYLEGGSRPTGVVTEMGVGLMEVEDEKRMVQPSPPPSNRYTDINFAAGKYYGEGIVTVFENYRVDPRLSDWGGLPADYYDDPGAFGYSPPTSMTTDPNQRVHLFHPSDRGLPANPNGSNWASWHELRVGDGPWYKDQEGQSFQTSKSSLNADEAATFGPQGFSFGTVRWYAVDFLLPLNVNGKSFNSPFNFNTLADIHSNGGNADPGLMECFPSGNSHPKYIWFSQTPDASGSGIPYVSYQLLQITQSNSARIASAYNVWHELVFGIKYSADNSGWFEVWFDGTHVITHQNRQIVHSSESGPYLQLQNYARYPISFAGGADHSVIIYGGARAGLQRADVQRS